jgi:Fe-S oxidoreductase
MFNEMCNYLSEHNIKKVLTACPSCHAIFNEYAVTLKSQSVYELLAQEDWQQKYAETPNAVTVQDSCVVRFNSHIHGAVRRLIQARGVHHEEMKHHGKKTLCCGEGGGAHFVAPELTSQWGETRRIEAKDKKIITYCAGCANFLGKVVKTAHVLDLIFDPIGTMQGKAKVVKSPLTYFKRLLLKWRFSKKREYYYTRERA